MRAIYKDKKRLRCLFGLDKRFTTGAVSFVFVVVCMICSTSVAYAVNAPPPGCTGTAAKPICGGGGSTLQTGDTNKGKYQCGSGKSAVYTSIDFGCKGSACKSNNPSGCSALTDAIFAIIRFLSIGVGLVIVASMVWAGLQYVMSRDDPSAVGKAKERILSNIVALLVYIFSYAILNYLIPKGFFG